MSEWQSQRTMTPRQYAEALDQLELNVGQAGRFLGLSMRTSYRYADGVTPIPAPTALLLRLMISHGERPVVPKLKKGQN